MGKREINKIKREFIERNFKKHQIVWPRDTKIINEVYEFYPFPEFWKSITLNFEVPAVAWFLTENGKIYLDREYLEFTTDLSPIYNSVPSLEIDEEIFIPETKKTIKTLRDFLG